MHSWPGIGNIGYAAYFTQEVGPNPIYGGWELEIRFSNPVSWIDQLESQLKFVSEDNMTYVLANLDWNANVEPGVMSINHQGICAELVCKINILLYVRQLVVCIFGRTDCVLTRY